MKQRVKDELWFLLPDLYWRWWRRRAGEPEPELELIPWLGHPNKIAIDVGANEGLYAHYLQKHFSRCYAFEPNPSLADRLRRSASWSRRSRSPRLFVEQVALSDREGHTDMRVPTDERLHGHSTIEPQNRLKGITAQRVLPVETRTLDSYGFRHVGLIKIDVEGHEGPVLRGASRTIESSRPHVLIESEERHKSGAVDEVHRFFGDLAYAGFYLEDGSLRSVRELAETGEVGRCGKVRNYVYLPTDLGGS